ncbi:MAG: ABC transporter permease, partial [Rhodothermales bacterium]
LRPAFETLTGKLLPLDYADNGLLMLAFLGVALLVGFGAGSYPAVLLSAFRPAHVLKAGVNQGPHGGRLRKGLVVFQFVISIVLMTSTAIVYDQLDYVKNKDLGFQKEQVVVVPIGHSENLRPKAEVVKQALAQHPNVISVSASHSIPSYWLNRFAYLPEGAALEDRISLGDVSIDHDFIAMYGMEVIAGRSFSQDLASDSTAFVLNESAAQALGWSSPAEAVGEQIEWVFPMGFQGPIIGVVKDFHFGSLHTAIPPIVFHISRFGSNFISARIRPDDVSTTLAFLEQTWEHFEPDYPFEYFFIDESFARLYEAEERLARTFGYGAALAILIACLGLFGLAAFMAGRRKKEIGVRKVLGASVPGLVLLLSKDFLTLVGVAFVVACPLTYLAMNTWLDNFAYRIDLSWPIFLGAGLIALLFTFLTVSYQSIRAALANPALSLRYE